MATAISQTTHPSGRPGPLALLRRTWALNAPLTLLGVVMVGTLLAALVGLVVDHQVITGAPAWLKPAKFAISVTIYCFTFVYLLQFVRGHRRLVAFVANATAVALTVEMVIIVGQVIRGTMSRDSRLSWFHAITLNFWAKIRTSLSSVRAGCKSRSRWRKACEPPIGPCLRCRSCV